MRRVNAASRLIRTCLAVAACTVAVDSFVCVGEARRGTGRAQNSISSNTGDLEVLQLRPNVSLIAGAGANIAVQIGDDGVVVVDAGSAAKGEAVVAAIKRISARPIRYVID